LKIPKNLTGKDLVTVLKLLGYTQTRQRGSHIRLTTMLNGQHHITIPNHQPLKQGTLSSIIKEVATHHNIDKEEVLKIIL
jgi:predicted RNA binding protein YcfA (HicA-like mRNA interferase family)